MRRTKQPQPGKSRRLRPLLVSTLRQERQTFVSESCKGLGEATTIASYNVHKCVGVDGRFDPDRTIAVIRELDADLVALQEADQRFGERAGLLDLHSLERQTGLVPISLPISQGGHGWHGNVLLIRSGTVTAAHQLSLPGAEPRGALVVELDLDCGPLRIIAAHLGLLRRSRALQAHTLLQAIEPGDDVPTLLMGDLNEWRLGKRSSLSGLEPHFGPLEAAIPSFPSRFPIWALDRVLAKPHDLISSIAVHNTPKARMASDHLPLKAVVRLGNRSDKQAGSDALAAVA
ncbi:MAG: endonuclease/exonuclease/phosphatase family protein [Aurantimonas endophytica]|uniref:endonuclease/exonuclease/phosphatase family protein n=1 Tax=Aurantimonas endophytica TaxID=1522175 RepID=UPI0030035ACE